MIRRVLGALVAAFAMVVLGDLGTAYAVDCEVTPEDPGCVEPTTTPEPTPTVTVTATVTETATPSAVPVATATASYGPFAPTGIVLDPATGEVSVNEDTGVALGVALFVGSVVGGLVTSQKVLP